MIETSTQAEQDIANKQCVMLYEAEITAFVARKEVYQCNKGKAHAFLWGQCSKTLQSKLQALTDYESRVKGNPFELLKSIQTLSMQHQEKKCAPVVVLESIKNFFNLKQKDEESLVDCTWQFKSARDVMEAQLGNKLLVLKLGKQEPEWDDNDQDKRGKANLKACNKLITTAYLYNSDRTKCGSIIARLNSQFSLGNNQFPTTLQDATAVLTAHCFDATYKGALKKREDAKLKASGGAGKEEEDDSQPPVVPEMSFTQLEGKCHCCGKGGHKSTNCRNRDKISREEWAINKLKQKGLLCERRFRADRCHALDTGCSGSRHSLLSLKSPLNTPRVSTPIK